MTEIKANYLGRQLATHLREVHLGGNWCEANYKACLSDLSYEEAIDGSRSNNSILTLVYHTHYYVKALGEVLAGLPLNSKDAESFKHPHINKEAEWRAFVDMVLEVAESTAKRLDTSSNEQVMSFFSQEKYGSTFRNTFGIIEHLNYHLGQIVLLKIMLRQKT